MDVAVMSLSVALSIAVSVGVAPLVSVGTPVIPELPVPIEVDDDSHPDALEVGIDMVTGVLSNRGVLAPVPAGPVHWPVLDGTASDPDPIGMILSSQSSACARCRFELSWS